MHGALVVIVVVVVMVGMLVMLAVPVMMVVRVVVAAATAECGCGEWPAAGGSVTVCTEPRSTGCIENTASFGHESDGD